MPRKVLKMIAIDIHQQVAAIFTCDIWHQNLSLKIELSSRKASLAPS